MEQQLKEQTFSAETRAEFDEAAVRPAARTNFGSENFPASVLPGETVVAVVPVNPFSTEVISPYDYPVHTLPAEEVGAVVELTNENQIRQNPPDEPGQIGVGTPGTPSAALLGQEESGQFRKRWNEIQGLFVDEPRAAVQQADVLVSDVIEQINQLFANNHSHLESQWLQGQAVSTEDLRMVLQHYRTFFNRLVV